MMENQGTAPTYTEAWLPGYDGMQFYTRTYPATAPAAVLLFVHGFGEHVSRYEPVHGQYAGRGITVFTFDQRGFGRTAMDPTHRSAQSAYCKTTFREQFADIEWWLRHVVEAHPDLPVFLMGHFMVSGRLLLPFQHGVVHTFAM